MNQKLSISPKLELDFSSADKLEKSLKAKKILGNVEINNIVNNVQNNDFVLNSIIKFLLEKVSLLEEEIKDLSAKEVNNDTNKKQTIKENILNSKDQINDCDECTDLRVNQKTLLIDNITKLYDKYKGLMGSDFAFKATFLDQEKMKFFKKQLHDVENCVDINFICQSHKSLSSEIKTLFNKLNSL